MQTEGTTPPPDGDDKRRSRHQQHRDLWRQHWAQRQQRLRRAQWPEPRPLWQEPVRGALYAVGGSAITVLLPHVQHWF
ncbi:hypothetical protein [Streptomyces lydicus]|uniref:hypothetical protein n=1 Tax=Streptomyces lydicus TaxID=47763 RepID=UPI00380C01E9